MSLVSFARRTRVLEVGGLRFVCRPPTVATVARAYELLLGEIWALAKMVYQDGRSLSPDDVLDGLIGDARFAAILETCVDMPIAAPAVIAQDEALQRRLALACASLVEDWPAVIESLHMAEFGTMVPGEQSGSGNSDGPSEHEVAVWTTATACGQSPQSVAAWPYEDLLAASKVARWVAESVRPEAAPGAARGAAKPTSVRADAHPDALAQHGLVVPFVTRRPVT